MKCNDLGLDPCELKGKYPTMKEAGDMVSLDLEKPIDVSQMNIYNIQAEPLMKDFGQMYFKRTTVLKAFVINDDGDEEELKITFELKSSKLHYPKNNEHTTEAK